jgi:hypothetical protein
MFDAFAPLQKKLLDALAKNVSIHKVHMASFSNGERESWTDADDERLEYLRQRNVSISHIMTSPNSIPLSVWPLVFQAVQKTYSRSFLIFQGLRGLADCLPETSTRDEGIGRHAKRKGELFNEVPF